MTEKTYLLASQVAEMLGKGWSRQRVHMELSRGTFPDPSMYVGKSPLWTIEQVEKVKRERGI